MRRLLGHGGMGLVYQAYDREREIDVALKTLKRVHPGWIARFKREFRTLADVIHPNLVKLYELFSDGDDWFFTMELLQPVDFLSYVRGDSASLPSDTANTANTADSGTSTALPLLTSEGDATATGLSVANLSDLTNPTAPSVVSSPEPSRAVVRAPADVNRLRPALLQLIRGVNALHRSGHLHRDIKPSNALVTDSGRVVLVDFGVVTEVSTGRAERSSSAGLRDRVGTPAYMSPEQGQSDAAASSDWYSVGVVLYEALSGRRPFSGTAAEMLSAKREIVPAAPSTWHEVDPQLEELCMRLLDRDPGRRPDGRELLRSLGGKRKRSQSDVLLTVGDGETLVGREAQLAELRSAFEQVRAGSGHAVFVSGASGMGKTVLLQRFSATLSSEPDLLVLAGRCYERESVPYKGVDNLVDALTDYLLTLPSAEVDALLPVDVGALLTAFPVLRRVEAVLNARRRASAPAQDPLELRRRAFAALHELLARLASKTLLVLLIDDLQWGDSDSAPFLAGLLRPPGLPLLLLACYRSEEAASSPLLRALEGAIRAGSKAGMVTKISVDALSIPDSEAVARQLLLAVNMPLTLAGGIAASSGGSPLFLHELVRAVAATPDLVTEGGVDLDDVIRRRAASLSTGARMLVELIAVAGVPIELGVARRAAELGAEFPTSLAELRGAKLVRTSGVRDVDRMETYHDRIRETLTGALADEQLRRLHLRLAAAMESLGDANSLNLAHHYAAAGEAGLACEYAARAGDAAAEALAFERAAGLFRLARDYSPKADVVQRSELARKMGESLANAGRAMEAAEAFEQAAPAAPPTTAVALRAAAGSEFLRAGRLSRGNAVLEPVLGAIGLRLSATPLRAVLSLLYRRAFVRLRGMRFKERTEEQVPAEMLARIDAQWKVVSAMGMVDTVRGAHAQAQHVLYVLRHGDLARVGRAVVVEYAFTCVAGRRAKRRCDRLMAIVESVVERTGDPLVLGLSKILAALFAYQMGHVIDCRDLARAGESILREQCRGATWEMTSAQLYWMWSLYWTGDYRELSERTEGFVQEARDRGDLYATVSLTTGVPGFPTIASGRCEDARAAAESALEQWSGAGYHLQHFWANLTLVHCDLYDGDVEAAYCRTLEQWSALRKSFLLTVAMVRFETTYLRALCALGVAARFESRRRALHRKIRRDARALERSSLVDLRPLGTLIRAGLEEQRGHRERAIDLLMRAEQRLTSAGIRMYAAAARYRRGCLLDNDQGADLIARAAAFMSSENVAEPRSLAQLLVP